ncbi:hypothetical protein BH11CYA1_BH11CYA1_22280 [soil metagenome]
MINNNRFSLALLSILLFSAGLASAELGPCLPAQAQGSDESIENAFSSTASPSTGSPAASIPPLASPLSGSVRVIDQYAKPTRLKRIDSNPVVNDANFPAAQNTGANTFSNTSTNTSTNSSAPSFSGQRGGISDSGLQALFPSKDSFNPPPSLSGAAESNSAAADAVKAKKKHVYIWNMSLAGGYYDVTNTFQGVVPGNKLYLYGGFMADGHTPVPKGPVEMNQGGHIRWTPTMGAPPED